MKYFSPCVFIVLSIFLLSCGNTENKYQQFGNLIDDQEPIKMESLSTIDIQADASFKLTGTVDEVCQAKGCWMILKNENGIPVRVTFKDYGFFVPKDIAGRQVIVNGTITKKELEPDMAKHYADDANSVYDSTRSYLEYAFIADGVLVSNSIN
ncbi:MAG: hypothetical protein ACJA08_002294 [Cyclobacteriaceae bacterium]|jgi:hypothetical protein